MTRLFWIAPLLLGAGSIYLYVVTWSFRASKQRVCSLPWLFLPLGGALLAGILLALCIPPSPASPLSLRLLELLAHLCNILLIWTITSKFVPAYRLAGTWLYAWNPLVLIELAGYANTAGIVTCLLLLAVVLLMRTSSSPRIGIVPVFRRGGGGVDDGRGRLRRPPSFAERFVNNRQDAGDASVPSQPDPTPAPTEDERAVPLVKAGDASVPSQPDPTPAPTERERSALAMQGQTDNRPCEIAVLVLVGLALRINFMTLVLAPLLLWFMVRRRRVGSALGGFAWRALVALGVFVVAYLPDWRGSETFLAITNGIHLFDFSNSPLGLVVAPARALFAFVAQRANFPPLMQPTTAADMTVLATSFFLFALLYLREMGRVRAADGDARRARVQRDEGTEHVISEESRRDGDRHKAPTHPPIRPLSLQDARENIAGSFPFEALFTGWAIVIVGYIVLAATVFLPGYTVWGVWVVSLRRFDTLSVCMLLLSCSTLLAYPLQWSALASTGFLLPLCVFGIPLVYLVVQYCLPAGRMERKKVLK